MYENPLNFPLTRPDTSPLEDGDQYTGDNGVIYTYNNGVWDGIAQGLQGTPALGDRLTTGSYSVILGADGSLTLPNSSTIKTNANNSVAIVAGPDSNATAGLSSNDDASWMWVAADGAHVSAESTSTGYHLWTFGLDGTLTVPGDIHSDAGLSITVGDHPVVADIAVDSIDEYPGAWRLFISDILYPDLGTTVTAGATVTASWGSEITANVTDNIHDAGSGWWVVMIDQDLRPSFSHLATVTFGGVDKSWQFGLDGNLTLPNGMTIDSYSTLGVNATVTIGGDNTKIRIDNNGAPPGLYITTDAAGTPKGWLFDSDGNLTLPDNSRLNSGGIDVRNSAEIKTTVNRDGGDSSIINTSEIALQAGNGGISAQVYGPWDNSGIHGSGGPTLVYAGVENLSPPDFPSNLPGFAGFVAIDPGVTSQYAVSYGEDGKIFVSFGEPITTESYIAALGVLTDNIDLGTGRALLNGILVNPNDTIINGKSSIIMSTDRGTVLFGNQPEICGPTGSSHFHIMKGGDATDLFFGDDFNYVKLPNLDNGLGVEIGTDASNIWRFGTDGVLTFPNGSTIGDSEWWSGVPITTARGTIYLGNSPVIGQPDHFHIMKGGQQDLDLFFGDDSNFVKLPSNGGVEITSQSDNQYSWTFGTDGTTKIPNDSTIRTQDWGSFSLKSDNANIVIMTDVDNSLGWTFGTSGSLAFPNALNDANSQIYTTNGGYQTVFETFTTTNKGAGQKLTLDFDDAAVKIQSQAGTEWKFGQDGNLTFPNGDLTIGHDPYGAPAIIGAAGKNIGLVSSGVGDGYEVGSSLIWVDSITEPTKIAGVTANNPLFAGAGDVGIVTGDYFYTGNTNVWNFGADGKLTVPGEVVNKNDFVITAGTSPAIANVVTSGADSNLTHWQLFVSSDVYPTLGTDVQVGATVYIPWRSITVNVIEINQDVGGHRWVFVVDQNVILGYSGGASVSFGPGQASWTFGTDGTTTLPGKLWAKASDSGSISFTNNGTDEHGYIKVDAGYNMTTNVDSNYYVKRASQDRLAITDTTSDFMASTDVRIKSNKSGSEYVWTFHDDGGLTFPIGNKFFGDEIITADYSGDTIIHGNQHITGNLQVDGVFTFTGTATILSVSSATFFGDTNGFGAFYAGVVGYTPLPVTVAQFTADYNDYVQLNFQNLNNGVTASTEWVATADNGNDTNNYIDMGIASSQWNGQQTNSVGTAADINDSWIYVQGDTTSSIGGNLIVGTIKNGKSVKILAGSNGADSVVAQFDAGGLVLSTGTVLTFADGSVQTTAISTTGSVVLQTLNVTNLSATNITLNGQPITGAIGYTGSAGNNGFIGSAGSVGYIGSRGYIGSAGTNGFIGSAGTNGFIGSAGTNGTNGYTGSVGVGYTGSAGMVSATNLTNLSTDISFSTVGIGAPTFITTSTGTKISYYPSETVSMVDYATGIEAGVLWNSIPSATSNFAFKWYGGTSTVATLNGLGTLTANKFVGDGSSLTNVTLAQAGNIIGTGTNVSLVAGSYTYLFDNTGVLTLPAQSITTGSEGAEIDFTKAPSSTLSGSVVVVDQYADRLRFFEGGGTNRGVYIDLTQAAAGVNTLLNNRVSGFVNAGTFVTMDLIKATVTTSGQRALSLATTTGTLTYNIGATYALSNGAVGGASLQTQTLTTSATTSIFGWSFPNGGDTATYILTDTTNSRCYRITLMVGSSYNNNMISIERLI